MSSSCNKVKGKKSWPELVGTAGQAAAAIIESQNRNVDADIVEEGSIVSTDFRCDRVRVFVDADHVVKDVPRVVEGKKSWPELVGASSQIASAVIESENQNMDAFVVEEGSIVTIDVQCDRVWVFVDGNNVVTDVPLKKKDISKLD